MTITHSPFHREIDDIMTELKQHVDHLFIEKYVSIPQLPLVRLQLLNILLYQASFPRSLRKLYCVTSGLIQMGLDVHEEIVNQKQHSDKEVRSRQLSILAGDYYSSQYYLLLSRANLIDGVKTLASGIRDINIAKMKVYTENNGKGFQTFDQLIQVIKEKESALYLQFLDQLPSEENRLFWKPLLENLLLLIKLNEESQEHQISRHHISYLFVNYFANSIEKAEIADNKPDWKSKVSKLHLKYNINGKIQDLMHSLYHDLNQSIEQIDNIILKTELGNIIQLQEESLRVLENVVKEI